MFVRSGAYYAEDLVALFLKSACGIDLVPVLPEKLQDVIGPPWRPLSHRKEDKPRIISDHELIEKSWFAGS